MHAHTDSHMWHACANTHTCTHIFTKYKHVGVYMELNSHTHTHTLTCVQTHTCIHIFTKHKHVAIYMELNSQTHTHTHTHTHTQSLLFITPFHILSNLLKHHKIYSCTRTLVIIYLLHKVHSATIWDDAFGSGWLKTMLDVFCPKQSCAWTHCYACNGRGSGSVEGEGNPTIDPFTAGDFALKLLFPPKNGVKNSLRKTKTLRLKKKKIKTFVLLGSC